MNRLNVALISGILHPKYGGPPSVIKAHREGLAPYANTKVFGISDPGDEAELRNIYPECDLFPAAFPKRWFRGKGLRKALTDQAPHFDILHAHMFWDHAVWAAWRASKKNKKPFIVTPHGSILNVWRWKPFHKIAYREWILKIALKDCAFVHALNTREERGCHEFGVSCPIRVIPNGLPEAEYLKKREPQAAWTQWPSLKNKRILLYMGRLSQLKGLDMLPQAWAACLKQSQNKDWMLVIAGPDYRGFSVNVIEQVKELGLEDRVLVTGPVYGEMKDSLLAAAEAFVLPSYTEGFSVAILEAIAASLPCLYTTECHFPELAEAGGGWNIKPEKGDLSQALTELIRLTPGQLRKMGQAANLLGRSKYTLEKVSLQLIKMYRDALAR